MSNVVTGGTDKLYTEKEVDQIVIERTEALREMMQSWIDHHYAAASRAQTVCLNMASFLRATAKRHATEGLRDDELRLRLTDCADILRQGAGLSRDDASKETARSE